jgi:hypothetical protein
MNYVIYSRTHKGFVQAIRDNLQICAYTADPNNAYKTTKEYANLLATLCNGTVFMEVI